ncbi:MAG: translocation/assembly module TamB domain-containing protein [Acidobacteria bacterium]|nr:translocation/assembly module TamB domain-containing protein [Acidobacteriota bacterium]
MSRWRRVGSGLARGLVLAIAAALLLVVAAGALLQTPWAHDRLRAFVVGQANRYLTATLQIGHLRGSLFRGLVLEDVRLSRDGEPIVAIDRIEVAYSIRELIGAATSVQRLSLTRPRIVAARQADGRWNLAALVARRAPRQEKGPGRTVRLEHIEVADGHVTLRDPLSIGAAHVPTDFTALNATLSAAFEPGGWTLAFEHAAFVGAAPDLTVRQLSGVLADLETGWRFEHLHVTTPRSEFTLEGGTDRRRSPTPLDLSVSAPAFAFQEWSGILGGLRNIAVEAAFDTRLTGPPTALATQVNLRSTSGDVRAAVTLDSSIPGWHARGTASVQRLDLAGWLNRPDRPSDISGDVTLDLDLDLGGHFPRGAYTFAGSHAAYLGYEADDVQARGTITRTDVLIARATATAYGANVRLRDSTLAIDAPYPFHFTGTADGVDLRLVPRTVPVPHVESTLAFDYDVTGQFVDPFLTGHATFGDSVFLGATLGAGATGAIDTHVVPFHYAGEGPLSNVDLARFGRDLQIAWMTEPRYAGTVRGQFRVDGRGSELATMTLNGGGRLDEATLFGGRLTNADVSVHIADGSLEGTYDGDLLSIDPAIPMADPLYRARLTGRGQGRATVRDLLVRSPLLNDYSVSAVLDVHDSVVRTIDVTRGRVEASLDQGTLRIDALSLTGPGADLEASGALELDGERSSALDYRITRADLSRLETVIGAGYAGRVVTTGRLTGPLDRMRFTGSGTLAQVSAAGITARSGTATYDVVIPSDAPSQATGTLTTSLADVTAAGQALPEASADVRYDAGRVIASLGGTLRSGVAVSAQSELTLDVAAQTAQFQTLGLAFGRNAWRLAGGTAPVIGWTTAGVRVDGIDLVAPDGAQHLTVSGTWSDDGAGRLRVAADGVQLASLLPDEQSAARYGGILEATAIVGGTREHPTVAVDFAITDGRIRRLAYQSFAGHADYTGGVYQVDVRLDQAPGVWFTAAGAVPASVFTRGAPPEPMHLAVKSSDVSLTLLEGVTDVVKNVNGQMRLDVTVIGTTSDPHFSGRVDLANASFDVVASGARYRNGRLALQLASDRVSVDSLRVEDEEGNPLEVTGSLGTHELRVGDLQVAVNARSFQVLRNEYGRVDIDARLNLSGEFESPRLTGRLTVTGGALNVDRILDRTLFQPYSTQAASAPADIDPIVALNPWERMGMDLELHVPGTLRMTGDNVQITPGTPLGLGNINVRAFGDLSLYKDPAQPMYVNGSFDSLVGTYAFQGRRFDLNPSSSINFRGDLNPELYITVNRIISGVETRVSIVGPLREPELRLASTPPLDQSDILSLIVFNTSMNELSALQQQQLAVRAGTLAAGFIAAPMMTALERTLGIDTLEIEPGADIRGGPRVTVGNEIAPGLVARFSRQFGESDYDEATIEYYLSRILRIRATFSDASSLSVRSPFRRVERAGIDLLLFFSF